jgi:hypothetical protein
MFPVERIHVILVIFRKVRKKSTVMIKLKTHAHARSPADLGQCGLFKFFGTDQASDILILRSRLTLLFGIVY